MSSDDSDRTVFKPAISGSPDHTLMRPMPGGRNFGDSGNTLQQPAPLAGVVPRNAQRQAPAMDSQASYFRIASGLNPLVDAASPLIAVFEKTRKSMSHPNVGGLHQRLTSEIRIFETRVREMGVAPEIALSTRYLLCSALDEAVLNTPWGSDSAWAQRTLLSVFHNETSGGEKFFLILDRVRQSPAENINVLELIYILLSLGFEGKYRLMSRGRDAIETIRDDLFSIIRNYRGEYERNLSDRWQGLGQSKNTLAHYIPMWVIVTLVVALLFFGFSGFRYWLYETATPVYEQLETISTAAIDEQPLENKNVK
ncbi:MAG: type VI secretion system protein ImpK [Lentisphaeria bacterium]|jgi:type VI secretion system protein ImpK